MARQFIYHMQDLSKVYPGNRKVLENINLSFYPDAKIGVLGVNGAGKSTLLRIMAGLDQDYTGEAWAAEGARVGYLPQEPQLDQKISVRENVMQGVASQKAILDRYNELAANYSDETADEMTKLQDEIEAKGLWDLDSKVDQAMDALRCPPDDAYVAQLSGGERRRVALCRLLLAQPDLLLLDEPTNHLDAESVSWLEGHLRNYPGAILIVTHDRYFLDNVTGWILELDRGRGIPYQGNYSSWLVQKQKRLEQEGREEEARQRTLAREQEWITASPRARQAKSKARYERYEELLKKAGEKQTQTAQIVIPVAGRHRRNHRPERRRQEHAVPHNYRRRQGGRRYHHGRRVGASRLCRPVARLARRQEVGVGGNLRRPRSIAIGQTRGEFARLLLGLQFQGRRPAEEGRIAVGRRTKPRASRQDAQIRR